MDGDKGAFAIGPLRDEQEDPAVISALFASYANVRLFKIKGSCIWIYLLMDTIRMW